MRCGEDVLEVGELAQDGSRRNDPEADPHAPDRTTEDREDTGTKELKSGQPFALNPAL